MMCASQPVVVRWLAAYRRQLTGTRTAAWAETLGIGRERAAEPLWRGRSLLLAEQPTARIGLGFAAAAVRRAFWRDVWSEPSGDRLSAGATPGARVNAAARRGWRDWDRFARRWARHRPSWHAEAWLADAAEPVAVCHRAGDAEAVRWAAELAVELGLPVIAIRAVEGHSR